ncbi:MAG: hypothetical protein AB8H79_00385 [Myxococcota bacterium]
MKPLIVLAALVFAASCRGPWALDRNADIWSHSTTVNRIEEVPVSGHRVKVWEVNGAWAKGELVAVDDSSIYVLTDHGLRRVRRPWADRMVIIRTENARSWHLAGWGVAGAFSTLTHGFLLVLTIPMWAIATTASIAIRESFQRMTVILGGENNPAWDRLYQYARFPQGLPPKWIDTTNPVPTLD